MEPIGIPVAQVRSVPTWLALVAAAAAGAGIELGVARAAGVREAWDAPGLLFAWLGGMMAVSALLGWASPRRAAWIGLATAAGQFVALWVQNPAGSMWVLGLGFAAGIGLLCMIASVVGGAIRLRRWRSIG